MPRKENRSLPVREVAERLGVSRQRIHVYLKTGRLKRARTGVIPGRYPKSTAVWITVQSIENFEAERRQSREQSGDE